MKRLKRKDFHYFDRSSVERYFLLLLILLGLLIAAWRFLSENPQHNPWAPLDMRDPPGWATASKLAALRGDTGLCQSVLERSGVSYAALAPVTGPEAACNRPDRTVLQSVDFSGSKPSMTCPVAAGLHLWLEQSVQPAAEQILGSRVARVNHLGTYNCRRMYGQDSGPWSEHATGNAVDIAGFILEDGRQISLVKDWSEPTDKSQFLKQVRDDACRVFGTVLSPDYNAAHRDHFHLDQDDRAWSLCR